MLTAMICIASGSLPGAQAFACPAQRKSSVSFGGREVVTHAVYNPLLPTYDAFARNRKYEHPKWVKQVQKDPLREEKRARRVANDLHEEVIEMGQVPRMLSPRTASVGNTAAPVQFPPFPNSWMLDSGSGLDLVGRGDVDLDRLPPIEDLPRPLEVNTANSTVILKESVPVQIGTLGIVVKPVLMEDCPSVLSLGKRIVEEGYSFEWHHGRKPVLIAPDGTRTVCKVRNLCPYVDEKGSCLVAAPASSSSSSSRPVVVEASSVANPMDPDVEIQKVEPETDDEEEPRGRDLVAEAKSLEHQLTHRWKKPALPALPGC